MGVVSGVGELREKFERGDSDSGTGVGLPARVGRRCERRAF